MPVTEETYERVALEDPDGKWELHCGRLRSKPAMTTQHNRVGRVLGYQLQRQLPLDAFEVSVDHARVHVSPSRDYIPDVAVIPTSVVERMEREQPTGLESYADPLPLIVEVWSPSTGDVDVTAKLAEYRQRGDLEIWRIHPVHRSVTVWRRQTDGSYAETVHTTGTVEVSGLPGVVIEIERLFAP